MLHAGAQLDLVLIESVTESTAVLLSDGNLAGVGEMGLVSFGFTVQSGAESLHPLVTPEITEMVLPEDGPASDPASVGGGVRMEFPRVSQGAAKKKERDPLSASHSPIADTSPQPRLLRFFPCSAGCDTGELQVWCENKPKKSKKTNKKNRWGAHFPTGDVQREKK